ncbi:hypothetical protein UlMin_027264, partial [Ulmus minor]
VEGNEHHHGKVVKALQDIFKLVTNDMMTDGARIIELLESSQLVESESMFFNRSIHPQLFEQDANNSSIHFPLPESEALDEQ